MKWRSTHRSRILFGIKTVRNKITRLIKKTKKKKTAQLKISYLFKVNLSWSKFGPFFFLFFGTATNSY